MSGLAIRSRAARDLGCVTLLCAAIAGFPAAAWSDNNGPSARPATAAAAKPTPDQPAAAEPAETTTLASSTASNPAVNATAGAASTTAGAAATTQAAGAAPDAAESTTVSTSVGPSSDALSETLSETLEDRSRFQGWAVLPAVFYLPEWGFSATAAALVYFRTDRDSDKKSELRAEGTVTNRGGFSTSLKPKLWLGPYKLRSKLALSQREREYYGIGNDTPSSDGEIYDSRYVALYLEGMRQVVGPWRVGVTGYIKKTTMLTLEPGGLLDMDTATGSDGGLLSGVGILAEYDTRDDTYGPRDGILAQSSVRVYNGTLGSDYDFVQIDLDFRRFIGLPWGHVLGVHARSEMRFGDSPFNDTSNAGGKSLLRGMLKGRYRDNHMAGAQLEYRLPLWWRFGAVGFAGLGRVASELDQFDLSGWKYSVGAGLRFAVKPKDNVNVRMDIGAADGEMNVYLDILESF